jgi:hypothetical protein
MLEWPGNFWKKPQEQQDIGALWSTVFSSSFPPFLSEIEKSLNE